MTRSDQSCPVLVLGPTGAQGGAAIRALLRSGRAVRALVRDLDKPAARALKMQGADLVTGDFDDVSSLDAAMTGVTGVFSVQVPPHTDDDPDSEFRAGSALVDAAHRAGVNMFVHTSVARAGDQSHFVDWDKGRWWQAYWNSKSAVNDAVRARGFSHHVILKPAFMMDNLMPPKVRGMFPALPTQGRIETAMVPDTRLDMIAADDIGAFAAAAFADPARFDGQSIDLAAEALTMAEVAAELAAVVGRAVTAVSMSEVEALASGIHPGVVASQSWVNVEGYRVDLDSVRRWGVPLTSFGQWIKDHRNDLVIGMGASLSIVVEPDE